MKFSHFFPPLLVLVIGTLWLGLEQQSISTLEKKTQSLRSHVAAARHLETSAADPSIVASKRERQQTVASNVIDWKKLLQSRTADGRLSETEARSVTAKLMAMSSAELVTALKGIATLELNEEDREALENTVLGVVAKKEPQLALECAGDKINDSANVINWSLAAAFQRWAAKDLTTAAAWLDKQIADGKLDSKSLDGKNQARMRFETALVSALLSTDLAAADQRIAAVPESQRSELFGHGSFIHLAPGKEKDYVDLVRKHVPEDQWGAAYSSVTGTLVHQGGYEEVGKFLGSIEANPAERRAIAAQAVNQKMRNLAHESKQQVTRDAIVEMRNWINQQSPDAVNKITGEELAKFMGNQSPFEDRVKLVEEFHAESGSDELLIGFLNNPFSIHNREAALALAAKISDEGKRAEIIKNLSP